MPPKRKAIKRSMRQPAVPATPADVTVTADSVGTVADGVAGTPTLHHQSPTATAASMTPQGIMEALAAAVGAYMGTTPSTGVIGITGNRRIPVTENDGASASDSEVTVNPKRRAVSGATPAVARQDGSVARPSGRDNPQAATEGRSGMVTEGRDCSGTPGQSDLRLNQRDLDQSERRQGYLPEDDRGARSTDHHPRRSPEQYSPRANEHAHGRGHLGSVTGIRERRERSLDLVDGRRDHRDRRDLRHRSSDSRDRQRSPALPEVMLPDRRRARSMKSHREPTFTLPVFREDGNLDTFLSQFDRAAVYCGWTEEDELFYMGSKVEGAVADLVSAQQPSTLSEMKHLLISSYGRAGKQRQYRAVLRDRLRRPEESLQSLCADIRRMARLAFPLLSNVALDDSIQEHFVRALGSELRERVLIRGPLTLEDTLTCAIELDHLSATASEPSEVSKTKPVRSAAVGTRRNRVRRAAGKKQADVGSTSGKQKGKRERDSERCDSVEKGKDHRRCGSDQCISIERSRDNHKCDRGSVCRDSGNDRDSGRRASVGRCRERDYSGERYRSERGEHEYGQRGRDNGQRDNCCRQAVARQQRQSPVVYEGNGPYRSVADIPRDVCYNCLKRGHRIADCRAPRRLGWERRSPADSRADTGVVVKDEGSVRSLDAEAFVTVVVCGREREAILDSGCTHSILPSKWVPRKAVIRPVHALTTTADNRQVTMVGQSDITFKLGGREHVLNVWISDRIPQFLLGYDWLGQQQIDWRVGASFLTASGVKIPVHVRPVGATVRAIFCASTTEIPPSAECVIPICSRTTVAATATKWAGWVTQPGVLSRDVHSARTALSTMDGTAGVLVANFSDHPIVVLEGTPFGIAEAVGTSDRIATPDSLAATSSVAASPQWGRARTVVAIESDTGGDSDSDSDIPDEWEQAMDKLSAQFENWSGCSGAARSGRGATVGGDEIGGVLQASSEGSDDSHVQPLIDSLPPDLTTDERRRASDLVRKYSSAFSRDEYDMGRTKVFQHTIDTGDNRPVREALRRHPQAHLEFIDSEVDRLLQLDIVEPSASPWASNVVLVRKKNGQLRMCIDYRKVNAVTYKDAYPIPKIDACLDALGDSRYFSSLDLRQGYWQAEIVDSDRDKTAFVTRRGQFRFKVLPFGLCNAVGLFQRLQDSVLAGLNWFICLVYLDDIAVFSRTFDEHLERLELVIRRMQVAGLKFNPDKCRLCQRRINFLGYVVSANRIDPDAGKVSAILSWPVPTNLTELRAWLGLIGYYRRWIEGFARRAKPLFNLMRKDAKFVWSAEHQAAFDDMKVCFTSAPILALPVDGGEYTLDTDASDYAAGAVLQQEQNGQTRIIAYASRAFNDAESRYSTNQKELAAAVYGLKQFRQYLLGRKFSLRTDHAALTYLLTAKDVVGRQGRYLDFLAQFGGMTISHRPGVSHRNADSLSRRPHAISNAVAGADGLIQGQERVAQPPKLNTTVANGNGHDTVSDIDERSFRMAMADTNVTVADVEVEPQVEESESRAKRSARKSRKLNGQLRRVTGVSVANRTAGERITNVDCETGDTNASVCSVALSLNDQPEVGTAGDGISQEHPVAEESGLLPIRRVVTRSLAKRTTDEVDSSDSFPSNADIATEQHADPVLSHVIRWKLTKVLPSSDQLSDLLPDAKLYRGMLDTLEVKGGVLVRRNPPRRGLPCTWAIVLPRRLQLSYVATCHKEAGHQGRAKTAELVSRRCFFPRWRVLVASVCADCSLCATYCRGEPPRHGHMQLQEVDAPMRRLAMDLTGPHPTTPRQFKYILTVTDCFSRFLWAVPLRNHFAPTVCTALQRTVFDHFGLCFEIVSDQGTEFCSKLMRESLARLGIRKFRTTAYRPQSNGRCERAHRDMNAMFAKMVADDHRNWDLVLGTVTAAYNGTVNRSTGFTPNRLFMGREALTSLDLTLPEPVVDVERPSSYQEYVADQTGAVEKLRVVAKENSEKAASVRKQSYDRKVRAKEFSEGDRVFLRREATAEGLYRKWVRRNVGPFVVQKRLNEVNYLIRREPSGRSRVEHVDRLSLFKRNPPAKNPADGRDTLTDMICEPLRESARRNNETEPSSTLLANDSQC